MRVLDVVTDPEAPGRSIARHDLGAGSDSRDAAGLLASTFERARLKG
jgi:hypothetical protein